jgi:hypothetical protein
MEHFFPSPASRARRSATMSMKLANPWSASPARGASSDTATRQRGLTFVYLIAELWLHRYSPLTMLGCTAVYADVMPPKPLVQCVLCVVEHVCKAPFAAEAHSSGSTGGHPRRCLPGVGEMQEHVRALQRPVFEFLVHSFRTCSELQCDQLAAAVDVWIAWVSMGGKVRDNNADHHRRGNRIGAFTRQKSDRRELEPDERQWAAQNYAFYMVLPLRWVGATAKVARVNPDAAAKIVEKVVIALLDNLTIEYIDEISKLLQDEKSTDPRRSLVVQAQSRLYARVPEAMEIVDTPTSTFVEMHIGKGDGMPSSAREDEYQSERRFRELMRSLKQIFRDEDHESVRNRLRRLLHINPDSEQESSVQFTTYHITKTARGDWGFTCDESGTVISADDQRLPVGGRIARYTFGDRQAQSFTSRADLRTFLHDLDEVRFEIQEKSVLVRRQLDDGVPWLSNVAWAPVVPHEFGRSDSYGLADQFDCCGIAQLARQLNRHVCERPGAMFAVSVVLGLARACFGGTGVLATILVGVLIPRLPVPDQISQRVQLPHSAGLTMSAVPRFCFDFSFFFKSAFSCPGLGTSPFISLVFNALWVTIFGCAFKRIVVSDTMSSAYLLASCKGRCCCVV